jgi:hypothetical protein
MALREVAIKRDGAHCKSQDKQLAPTVHAPHWLKVPPPALPFLPGDFQLNFREFQLPRKSIADSAFHRKCQRLNVKIVFRLEAEGYSAHTLHPRRKSLASASFTCTSCYPKCDSRSPTLALSLTRVGPW